MTSLAEQTSPPGTAAVGTGRWLELFLLFVAGPGLISLGPRWLLLVVIVTGGIVCLALLRADPTFPRAQLFNVGALRGGLKQLLLRTAIVWTALLLFTLLTRGPGGLFLLLRTRPLIGAGVIVLYPILSAFPQELMYRTFFFHRYGGLFSRPATLMVTNALLFGWSHIIVHNAIAMLLATVGGLLFAHTYQRSRSTALVTLEHALYGDFVFVVGVGGMFVNGVRLLSRIIK
ncbi:MAG TPA: CPBP family intramembrane glutamic endopeptidase [Polyangia bacterium]|nr:CPBP family intramembrane glutamic endopeptidase [Polyangia bacterium]